MGDDKISPRFRKTKTDKWAVMAPVADLEQALAADGKIEVQKKSGDWSSFKVASLGKPFDVDGVEMCYGYAPGDSDEGAGESQAAPSAAQSPKRTGPAGKRAAEPRFAAAQSPPSNDPAEPLPEFQGSEDDQWSEF